MAQSGLSHISESMTSAADTAWRKQKLTCLKLSKTAEIARKEITLLIRASGIYKSLLLEGSEPARQCLIWVLAATLSLLVEAYVREFFYWLT
jgi:hypothetical protein